MGEITQEQIESLRSNFLKELETKGYDAIHPADLERIKTSDEWIRRFLLHHDCNEKLSLGMMWDTMQWRKDFKTNEINENNIRKDYLIEGGFFQRGRDKDGCALFIFKCKKHVKGTKDMDEVKRCVVYWVERLEREENGKPITLFFDMEGCGLSNMDIEFTTYLINLFKLYYPYFLNYIIILEMAWILNAAFKIIKSLLPEKAIEKLKIVKKAALKDWVPVDQQLVCWGGTDPYVFSFVPETTTTTTPNPQLPETVVSNNKKVHFADGSPMSDSSVTGGGEPEGSLLIVRPSNVLTFVRDGNDLTSTLELQSKASINISYKMKTTSPEKFRVRPSAGCLAPGEKASVQVTLLQGFQLGGLSRDKFLVMSMPIDSTELSSQELTELWKSTSGKNITQHRLNCVQIGEVTKNGSVFSANASEIDGSSNKLYSSIAKLVEGQAKLQKSLHRLQMMLLSMTVIVVMAFIIIYLDIKKTTTNTSVCYKDPPLP